MISTGISQSQPVQNAIGADDIAQLGKLAPIQSIQPRNNEGTDLRKRLEDRGISVGLSYVAETFTNWRGGIGSQRARTYLGSLVSSMSLDIAKMGIARGQFFLSGQSLHGRGINEAGVGAIQTASNLDAQRFSSLIEAWYFDSYFQGKLSFKAGRQYADVEFGAIDNGADFLNSSYGLIPTTPMPAYPEPKLGLSVWYAPADWVSWGAGIFQGGTLDALSEEGSPTAKGAFALFETKLEPFRKQASQRGSYRLGLWQQSRGAWLSTPAADASLPVRNYGLYATADHWFLRNSDSDESGGPGAFFQWGWSPSDRNEITGYTGGGLMYKGLVPGRRGDSIGVGMIKARLSTAATETVLELFYKFHLTGHMMIQPDVQWFRRPGGDGPNALIAGLRLGIEF
jgi:porin